MQSVDESTFKTIIKKCLKYCTLHHQGEQKKNDYTESVLNKIEDTYSYEDNAFPVRYEDIVYSKMLLRYV